MTDKEQEPDESQFGKGAVVTQKKKLGRKRPDQGPTEPRDSSQISHTCMQEHDNDFNRVIVYYLTIYANIFIAIARETPQVGILLRMLVFLLPAVLRLAVLWVVVNECFDIWLSFRQPGLRS